MFLLYQIWTSKNQTVSEKLYLSKHISCTTDPEEAYQFQTEEEAKDCISWLNRRDQWRIEQYTPPQLKEEEDSNDEG